MGYKYIHSFYANMRPQPMMSLAKVLESSLPFSPHIQVHEKQHWSYPVNCLEVNLSTNTHCYFLNSGFFSLNWSVVIGSSTHIPILIHTLFSMLVSSHCKFYFKWKIFKSTGVANFFCSIHHRRRGFQFFVGF